MIRNDKKNISLIITTILSISLFFGVMNPVEAVWGIGDLPVDVPNVGTNAASAASEGGSLGEQIADGLKEFGLDTASYMAGQAMQEQLVNKTLEWAVSGFEGNPFYVEDQGSFMKEFEDVEILQLYSTIDNADFGSTLGNSFSEFGDFSFGDKNTVLSILNNEKIPLEDKLEPTLSTQQLDDFSSDFKKGGWDAWEELAKPSNNPIGRKEIIEKEYKKQVDEAQKAAEQELAQNDGFQSQKECVSETGNSVFSTDLSSYGFNIESNNFNINNSPDCERYTTETPGKVVSDSTADSTGAQFASLPQIDEISEIASQALGNMLIGLTNKGLSALAGSSGTSEAPASSGIEYLGTEVDNVTNSDGSLDWLNSPNQSVDLEIELPEAIENSGLALNYLQKTVDAQRQYLPIIIQLDYLLPGPDLGWKDRLQDYWQENSNREQMIIARKQDIDEGREDHFETYKKRYAQGAARTQEHLNRVDLRVFDLPLDSGIRSYVDNLEKLGREDRRAREQLSEMQNLHLQLVAIKQEIEEAAGFTGGESGYYNGTTDEWVGDVWMSPEQWEAWRNEGITDGQIDTNSDGSPVEVVRAREELRRLFLGLQRSIPKASALTNFRNGMTGAQFSIKDMKRLRREAEEFWANNYRVTQNGEDYGYWNSLYSWFIGQGWTTGASLGTTSLGVYLNYVYGTHQPVNDPGGPWNTDEPHLPSNWGTLFNSPTNQGGFGGFQTNNVLLNLLDDEGSVTRKLMDIENAERSGNSERRFYSMSPIIGPWNRAPWNMLRRDRENRLYCGYDVWPYSDVSKQIGAGDARNDRYDPIWCTETRSAERSGLGWYRADSFDYTLIYRPDLAGMLIGI